MELVVRDADVSLAPIMDPGLNMRNGIAPDLDDRLHRIELIGVPSGHREPSGGLGAVGDDPSRVEQRTLKGDDPDQNLAEAPRSSIVRLKEGHIR